MATPRVRASGSEPRLSDGRGHLLPSNLPSRRGPGHGPAKQEAQDKPLSERDEVLGCRRKRDRGDTWVLVPRSPGVPTGWGWDRSQLPEGRPRWGACPS